MGDFDIPEGLAARMAALGVREEDLDEQFTLGGGAGGQKINKTSSCVRLVHGPSGEEVRCQETRSREKNRILAREVLCGRLEAAEAARRLERARVRAIKRVERRRPSPGEKRRRKEAKQKRSSVKSLRRRPGAE